MSYRPMVLVGREWAGNGVRFATEEEALSSARDLMSRWFLVESYGSEYSEDPVNYAWDPQRGNVRLEVLTCDAAGVT